MFESIRNHFGAILLAIVAWEGSAQATVPTGSSPTRIGAYLQAEIHASPTDNEHHTPGKVQPGTMMLLSATLKNVGDVPSAPGTAAIRFALPAPLDKQPGSVLFETESEGVPSLMPGQALTINFSARHLWPSLFDFVRNDWAMREYEAVVTVGNEEYVTGTLPISFSAFYYEGPGQEQAARVLSAEYPTPKPTASQATRPVKNSRY